MTLKSENEKRILETMKKHMFALGLVMFRDHMKPKTLRFAWPVDVIIALRTPETNVK